MPIALILCTRMVLFACVDFLLAVSDYIESPTAYFYHSSSYLLQMLLGYIVIFWLIWEWTSKSIKSKCKYISTLLIWKFSEGGHAGLPLFEEIPVGPHTSSKLSSRNGGWTAVSRQGVPDSMKDPSTKLSSCSWWTMEDQLSCGRVVFLLFDNHIFPGYQVY